MRDVKVFNCADCGAKEVLWASVTKCVLICSECASVHRSFGRHISHVRSIQHLRKTPHLLNLMKELADVTSGANAIWEHSLLDPGQRSSSKVKPQPTDAIHPNKSDYINAKYVNQAYTHRLTQQDDEHFTTQELSKQLLRVCKTSNVFTALQCLVLGAKVNYRSPFQGHTPLHAAAAGGQPLQVELLSVYGADPCLADFEGFLAEDYARREGFVGLSARISELKYVVTDTITHFLCGTVTNHTKDQHLVIPTLKECSLESISFARSARNKLQQLPNRLFDDLVCDVYDEVDRREADAVWLSAPSDDHALMERNMIPFLPVNAAFSSTRNQGRQKLARFNNKEFNALLFDILIECKRRQLGVTPSAIHVVTGETMDQEYEHDTSNDSPDGLSNGKILSTVTESDIPKSTVPPSNPQIVELTNKLKLLEKKNKELEQENQGFQRVIVKLVEENSTLRKSHICDCSMNGLPANTLTSGTHIVQETCLPKLPTPQTATICGTPSPSEHLSNSSMELPELRKQYFPSPTSSDPSTISSSLQSSNHPSVEDITGFTVTLSKQIQMMHLAAQDHQYNSFIQISEDITSAVNNFITMFAENSLSPLVRKNLNIMSNTCHRMQIECKATFDELLIQFTEKEQLALVTEKLIKYCYDIAKATKEIFATFE